MYGEPSELTFGILVPVIHSYSFIRLCDFIVVTMLHDLSVRSASSILTVLQDQVSESVDMFDLVQPIPDDIEEQEKALQVSRTIQAYLLSCDSESLFLYSKSFCLYLCIVFLLHVPGTLTSL